MRVALDTNVLVYAEGLNGEGKRAAAEELISRLSADTVVPAQVLAELFGVLIRKAKISASAARVAVLRWHDSLDIAPSSASVVASAMDLVVDHHLRIWDALILSASAEADCRVLLSEDLHTGFTWRGLTIVNPFASRPHPLMSSLVSDGTRFI